MSEVREEIAHAAAVEKARIPITLERTLGALAMGLICLISFANVIVRYVTDFSFAFTEEYSTFLLVFMTFVGATLASASNNHIRITVLVNRLPAGGGSSARCSPSWQPRSCSRWSSTTASSWPMTNSSGARPRPGSAIPAGSIRSGPR
ncbi:TRAP transporter small permease [Fodinicurvata halophila]|uniref:TRAP transporter small permease n=1 Tax=Fodinicurvata halophila TaxID=1419723 RepID=UPI00363427BA